MFSIMFLCVISSSWRKQPKTLNMCGQLSNPFVKVIPLRRNVIQVNHLRYFLAQIHIGMATNPYENISYVQQFSINILTACFSSQLPGSFLPR